MSDPLEGPAPPPGGPPRSTPLGGTPIGSTFGAPGSSAAPPGFGGQPPGWGQPPVAQPQWSQPPGAGRTNGLAVAGFVLALLWICTIGSLLGVIFGFVALSQIKRSNQRGRGLAIAGIVLGVLGIVSTIVITVVAVNTAQDVIKELPGEADDVTVVDCRIGSDGQAEAVLEITNDSSRTSGYIITMTFRSGVDDAVESRFTGVDLVDPGETVTSILDSGTEMSDSGLQCEATYVNRFASGGSES